MIEPNVFLGLVHYPVYNKNMQIISTAITNYDIHDISRNAVTYGVKKFFLIHPSESQKEIAQKIINYWQNGYGKIYNPDRQEALTAVEVVPDIKKSVETIKDITQKTPIIVTTDARKYSNTITYSLLREKINTGDTPVLLLFGTGWGIEKTTMQEFDYVLEPIVGRSGYNHLSVRSAVAIILDRLLSLDK